MISLRFSVARRAFLVGVVGFFGGVGWWGSACAEEVLRKVLQPFVEERVMAGAVVAVANKDRVLEMTAVGWMDVSGKVPMRTDALFWIASQSKPVTGVAMMILVDEGRVKLDDPVEKYIPEFRGQMVVEEEGKDRMVLKRPDHPIRVREVLSHTSGLPFKSAVEGPTLDIYPLEARVKSYAMMPLLFEPGKGYRYSNAGINTAGRIIEVVSGKRFDAFLEERIFRPLRMEDTGFVPRGERLKRVAKAYKPNAAGDGLEECPIVQLRYPLDDGSREPMPGGGLFSTASDVIRFYRMLANGGVLDGVRVLSEGAVRELVTDQTGEQKRAYGIGIGANGRSFSHGGAYLTNTAFDMERGLITLFLGQHASWREGGKEIMPRFQGEAWKVYAKEGTPVAPVSADGGKRGEVPVVGIPGESTERPKSAK
jgi:CubicO group peptidase (beta-lactamase class C family)